jgi:hypothetical protein
MRTRSTWQGKSAATPRQAATQRRADIYLMNQEHPQPGPTDYENGDPDKWAESWHGYGDVEAEYEGGHVKRNELNFAEFRDNTWKHKDSDNWHSGKGTYDNVKDGEGKFENTSGKSTASSKALAPRQAAEQKAAAVERIVRATLRTSNDKLITDVAVGYMGLPDRVIVATLRALDAVSPDALSPESKMRRALACTKLSSRLSSPSLDSSQQLVLRSSKRKRRSTWLLSKSKVSKSKVSKSNNKSKDNSRFRASRNSSTASSSRFRANSRKRKSSTT